MLLKISWMVDPKTEWIAYGPRPLERNKTQEHHQSQEGIIWAGCFIFQPQVSTRSQACSSSCQSWEWYHMNVYVYFFIVSHEPVIRPNHNPTRLPRHFPVRPPLRYVVAALSHPHPGLGAAQRRGRRSRQQQQQQRQQHAAVLGHFLLRSRVV